jgi:hypothetical protein
MAVLVGLGLAMLTGCEEKYQLTFVNDTHDHRDVQLTLPGEGPMMIGIVDHMGDRVRTPVTVDSGDLPVTVKWQAGDLGDSFQLDKHMSHKLWIHISPSKLPPVDENAEIHTHEKTETHEKVHEGTVVE